MGALSNNHLSFRGTLVIAAIMDMLPIIALAYLIGSIPSGLLLGKCAGLGDIRRVGSGNIGATNMVRAGGKWLGLLTLLGDAAKTIIVVTCLSGLPNIVAHHAGMELINLSGFIEEVYILGLVTMLGHCFPVWLRFQGGKGVATGLGLIAAIHLTVSPDTWYWLALFAVLWIGSYTACKIVSIASLLAFAVLPVFSYMQYSIWVTPLCVTLLVFIRHYHNMKRLIQGIEHGFR